MQIETMKHSAIRDKAENELISSTESSRWHFIKIDKSVLFRQQSAILSESVVKRFVYCFPSADLQ